MKCEHNLRAVWYAGTGQKLGRDKRRDNFDVIYEQRERVFHRDIQTRENNV